MITFPIKSLQGKICLSPFVMIEVTLDGKVRLCGCHGWQPTTVGNLLESSLDTILSSAQAQRIRQSIIDGTYEYCNEKLCGVIINQALNSRNTVPPAVERLLQDASQFEMPHHISVQGDRTCNLSCPSCRTQVIKSDPEQRQQQEQVGKAIADNIFNQPSDKRIVLEVSGTGELFASDLLLSLVNSIDRSKFPNLKLHIHTNGLLSQSKWHKIEHLEYAIEKITVSVDAADADTYAKIRRGGQWNQLLEAMHFLKTKKQQLGFKLHSRMIVQQGNWSEMLAFYQQSKSFDVDVIEYSRITNWGTWTPWEFIQHDVLNPKHPAYSDVQNSLEQIKKLPDTWFVGL